ncbi:hypothetical protein H8D30_04735 [bacterium]|nr:hypothetical protein [bacterium]
MVSKRLGISSQVWRDLGLAVILFAGSACGSGSSLSPLVSPSSTLLILASDFTTGTITDVRGGEWTVDTGSGLAGPDAAARSFAEPTQTVWILNRDSLGAGNNLVRVGVDGATPEKVAQWQTGFQSNPHDLWVEQGVAFITRYDLPSLLVLDSETGEGLGTIDLGGLPSLGACSAPDGLPEMDEIFKYGDSLFVTLQCLDRSDPQLWTAATTGKIAQIDILTHTMVNLYDLPSCRNPHDAGVSGDHLLISCTGDYEGGNDGALISFSFVDKAVTVLAPESDFPGEIMGLGVGVDDEVFLILYDSQTTFQTTVARWDPIDGISLVHEPQDGYWHNRIAVKEGMLWMAGGSTWTNTAGVYRLDLDTLLPVDTSPLSTGLPPQVMVWVGDPYFGGGGH